MVIDRGLIHIQLVDRETIRLLHVPAPFPLQAARLLARTRGIRLQGCDGFLFLLRMNREIDDNG